MQKQRKNTVIKYGELRKVAEMTGYSYDHVRKVLVYGNRSNKVISDTHTALKNADRQIEATIEKRQ